MAKNTSKKLTHQIIYQIYPRNFSGEGNFKQIENHFDRLVELGVDILYLLPIHPIGLISRKGSLGSPYSIADYYRVNEELGTLDDLKSFLDKAHLKGFKVMMDIVFNHTSKDHPWLQEYPEFYYRNTDGNFANKVGDWSDITDLDYNCQSLWDAMLDIAVYWAEFGFDGYRCDVASLVPLDFWLLVREKVNQVKPEFIWLAESVHKEFVKEMRQNGFLCHSDSELYQAFDITYDYDIFQDFEDVLHEKKPLSVYIDRLHLQEMIYPENYLKARAYENHDVMRLMKQTRSIAKTKNWITTLFMLKGVAFIYNGIETLPSKLPNLFDKDPIDWTLIDHDWVNQLRTLIQLKKRSIMSDYTSYKVDEIAFQVIQIMYKNQNESLVAYCNVSGKNVEIETNLADGIYLNQFNHEQIAVYQHKLWCKKDPIIIYHD